MTITRAELTAHVTAAFSAGPATRDRLLAYAAGSHARPELIDILHRLSDKAYASLGDLWSELGNIPVRG